MNFGFEIEEVERGEKGFLYSFRILDESESEFEKFEKNEEFISCADYEGIMARLHDMINRFGFQERFFKYESSYDNEVYALHYENEDLRLFCIRFGNIHLTIGGGGIKTTRTTQQDKALDKVEKQCKYVFERIEKRRQDGKIQLLSTGELTGNLVFERE